MRSPSNSLLFASLLTQFPPTTAGIIQSAVYGLLHLPVTVQEQDCGTYLGQSLTLSLGLTGYIETATGQPLTSSRINYLLAQGVSTLSVRSLQTCLTKNGVCSTCYHSSYGTTPPVGSNLSIEPVYYIGNQYFFGDGVTSTFPLNYDATNSLSSLVYINDALSSFGFTIENDSLVLPSAPAFGGVIAIRSLILNTSVFINHLAQTYSGDLIGLSPASSSLGLPVKRSLYEDFLDQGTLTGVQNLIESIPGIPQPLLTYGRTILSSLEALLYYLCLYATFT